MAGYKVPKFVEFRDELPMTNVGKVLRKDLKAQEKAKARASDRGRREPQRKMPRNSTYSCYCPVKQGRIIAGLPAAIQAPTMRLIIGMSGSSGVIYGIRMLEMLAACDGIETHLILSSAARMNIGIETDWKVEDVEALADVVHNNKNIGASIASGSFKTAGMVVVPLFHENPVRRSQLLC